MRKKTLLTLATFLLLSSQIAQANMLLILGMGKNYSDDLFDKENSYQIGVGYQLSEFLSFEALWMDYSTLRDEFSAEVAGDTRDVTLTNELRNYELSLLGQLPVSDTLKLSARIGYAKYDHRTYANEPIIATGLTLADGTPFQHYTHSMRRREDHNIYGLGISWAVAESVNLFLEHRALLNASQPRTLSLGVKFVI